MTHDERKRQIDRGPEREQHLRDYADELASERDALAGKLKASEDERYAALREMAKARDQARDAQSHYETLSYWQHEQAEERGGDFQRLYLRLKAAEQERLILLHKREVLVGEVDAMKERAEAAERDNRTLSEDVERMRGIIGQLRAGEMRLVLDEHAKEVEQARAEGFARGKAAGIKAWVDAGAAVRNELDSGRLK